MLLPSPGRGEACDAAEPDPMIAHCVSAGAAVEPQHSVDGTLPSEFSRQIVDEIPFLRRMGRRWHRARADADDLMQDTLVQALANAHLWQPGSNLRAWLATIMRNEFLAAVTRSNRWTSALQAIAAVEPGRVGDAREARLTLRDVGAVLRRLPGKQRSAVLLVCVEGKSYEEVAKTVGGSIGAVRCDLARARDRLRMAVHSINENSPLRRRPVRIPLAPAPPLALRAIPSALASIGAD